MQASSGPSPLPASPLPPSPYQQTYNPETGVTFTPAAAAPPASQPPPKKAAPKVAAVVFVIVIVTAILAFSGALDGLFNPASGGPNVQVTNTSASHRCPLSSAPTETFLFTLVNSDSADANVQLGFYLNDAQVHSGTYSAPSGTSTPYTETVILASCPPSGSTYYLDLVSVTAV